ncbi:hypothetical protein FKM82_008713 [Ascaphus truei]
MSPVEIINLQMFPPKQCLGLYKKSGGNFLAEDTVIINARAYKLEHSTNANVTIGSPATCPVLKQYIIEQFNISGIFDKCSHDLCSYLYTATVNNIARGITEKHYFATCCIECQGKKS